MIKKEFIEISGVPGSPYTRKMLALMRYRRIPYRNYPTNRMSGSNLSERYPKRPEPKVKLLPIFYFQDDDGNDYAECDSTPIIRKLEKRFKGREVVPPGALGFVNYLIEDYADEWLTKAMFHYRWHYQADIEKAGQMLPRWNNTSAEESVIQAKAAAVSALQISRLSYVGSNEITKPTIENSFIRLIDILDKLLINKPFILGGRPSSCDFALYGQLTCLALFDPTPQSIILNRAPRIHAWTETLEDLSGYELMENDWTDLSSCPEELAQLLKEIGRVYAPYLLANAEAVAQGQSTFDCEIEARAWSQNTFPYQAKCLAWIRKEFSELTNDDQSLVRNLCDRSNLSGLISS